MNKSFTRTCADYGQHTHILGIIRKIFSLELVFLICLVIVYEQNQVKDECNFAERCCCALFLYSKSTDAQRLKNTWIQDQSSMFVRKRYLPKSSLVGQKVVVQLRYESLWKAN